MLAPVVLFVYKRCDHTKRVLESLASNFLAEQTDVFIFSDGAKTVSDQDAVDQVRNLINNQKWKTCFRNVSIFEAETNKGLANSVINGVSDIIQRYGKTIVVEDDLILSKEFLRYMNNALDYYENIPEIWSISGYSFPMKALKRYPHDVFYSYRGCSWGWGTWKNRWDMVDWECKDYNAFIQDPNWIQKFDRGGSDLSKMLTCQMKGIIDSWAIRWCFAQSNAEMYTVYPKVSYVINDGLDGSGTHSGITGIFDTTLFESSEMTMEKLEIDPKITKEFWTKYSNPREPLHKKIIRRTKKLYRIIFNKQG